MYLKGYRGFESLSLRHGISLGPALRSGFRQQAPASLTPAKRLKFESPSLRQCSLTLKS